jgi:hypothetical protein
MIGPNDPGSSASLLLAGSDEGSSQHAGQVFAPHPARFLDDASRKL